MQVYTHSYLALSKMTNIVESELIVSGVFRFWLDRVGTANETNPEWSKRMSAPEKLRLGLIMTKNPNKFVVKIKNALWHSKKADSIRCKQSSEVFRAISILCKKGTRQLNLGC